MPESDDIQPCALSLSPQRRWLPRSPQRVHITGTPTNATMTAASARMFKAGRLEGALVASSKTRGYWIYEGSGFSAPLGVGVGDIADAFDQSERARANIPVDFR